MKNTLATITPGTKAAMADMNMPKNAANMKRNLNTPALDIVGNLAPTLPNNTGMAITKPSRMNGFPRNTAWGKYVLC